MHASYGRFISERYRNSSLDATVPANIRHDITGAFGPRRVRRTALVKGDLAAGRLFAPLDISLPIEAAYYVVAPEQTADLPKIKAFREWLITTLATT